MWPDVVSEASIGIEREDEWVLAIQYLDHQRLHLTKPYDSRAKPPVWTTADQQLIVAHFSGLAAAFPEADHEAADWGSQSEQELFLDDLLSLADLQGQNLVDLGCGTGAVLRRLLDRGVTPKSYRGFDVNATAVQKARENFPKPHWPQVAWFEGDCFSMDVQQQAFVADWVVASGLFGVRPQTWSHADFTQLAIGQLRAWGRWAKRGVLFNFIPAYDPSLKTMLDLKSDTQGIAYHRMERLWLMRTLREMGFSVKAHPENVNRMMVQCPLRLEGRPFDTERVSD